MVDSNDNLKSFPIKRVGFVIRKNCPRCARIVERITAIAPPDWEIQYEKEASKYLPVRGRDIARMDVDLIITVGGDGTVLWTLQNKNCPILGINMGGLGFLSEVEIGEVESSIYDLSRGKFTIERSRKLSVYLNDQRLQDCTNEVIIHSSKIAKIRKFMISTQKSFIDRLAADAVIIATPVGSTSYSFSAGGPIILPSLDAMVISYIAPFASRSRPTVLPITDEIRVKIMDKYDDCLLILDGQEQYRVKNSDEIVIKCSENYANFVLLKRSFFDRVHEKLVKNVVN